MVRTQDYGSLESAIVKLQGLSNGSQAAIASLIDRLADAEDVSVGTNHKLPNKNISHWLTKLRSERKSERTIGLYGYLSHRMRFHGSEAVHCPTHILVLEL